MKARAQARAPAHASVLSLVWAVSALLAATAAAEAPDADADAKVTDKPFSLRAFDEVVTTVRGRHIRPLEATPRPWVAAANAALSTLRPAEELLERAQFDAQRGLRPGFAGTLAPLRCGGPPREDIGRHRKPAQRWRPPWRREVPPWGYGQLAARDAEVESVAAWRAPFGEADFRCVLSLVLEVTPEDKRPAVIRRAAQWWLRAHDAHSRLADDEDWDAIVAKETRHADLGLTLRLADDRRRWQIATVARRGPAAEAGVAVGDDLLAIDGAPTDGLQKAELAARLTRKPGTRVVLRVQTPPAAPRDAVLTVRELAELDVTGADVPGWRGARLVKVQKFALGGEARFDDALRPGGKGALPRGLLLDLRGNGGGVFPVALAMLARLTGGDVATIVTTREGSAEMPIPAVEAALRLPAKSAVAVLIDAGCGSACELMTAALRHHRRALVLGGRSYGKATLQDGTRLTAAGGRVLVTIGHFSTPGGAPLHARGVVPDVKLEGARDRGPREEDQAFVLALPDGGRPSPRPAIDALRRCVTRARAVGQGRAPVAATGAVAANAGEGRADEPGDDDDDASPAERAVGDAVVRDALAWLRCASR